MSYASYLLPHVHHASRSSASNVNSTPGTASAHPHSKSTRPAAAPGVQRALPFLLAPRTPQVPRPHTPLGYSSNTYPAARGVNLARAVPASLSNSTNAHATQAAAAQRKARATCTLSLANVSAAVFRSSSSSSSSRRPGPGVKAGAVERNELFEVPVPRVELAVHEEHHAGDQLQAPPTLPAPQPSTIPRRARSRKSLAIQAEKEREREARRQRQREINIIPFPSSEATRTRSSSVSSSYSSTSSTSSSSSSSSSSGSDSGSGSNASSTSNTSVSSLPSSSPHVLLRQCPPVTSRRTRGVIGTTIATATATAHVRRDSIVDDRDPPSPSSPTSTNTVLARVSPPPSTTLLALPSRLPPSVAALKAKLAAAEAQILVQTPPHETTPPPPYSALPPPYSALLSKAGAEKKVNTARPLPALPELPQRAEPPPQETAPLQAPIIHAPVPRAAFVRVEPVLDEPAPISPPSTLSPPVSPKIRPSRLPVPVSAVAPASASSSSSSPPSSSTSLPAPSPAPIRTQSPPPRRPRVPTSELKVLVFLYRTVVGGLERRYRLEGQGPVPRVDAGDRGNGKHKEVEVFSEDEEDEVSRFPLVEDDEDEAAQEYDDEGLARTPHSSPATSPVPSTSSEKYLYHPSRCACGPPCSSSASCVAVASRPKAKSKAKSRSKPKSNATTAAKDQVPIYDSPRATAKATADSALDVQDALLAIRLRGFLRAQGVPAADLDLARGDVEDEDQVEADGLPLAREGAPHILVEDDGDPFADADRASSSSSSAPSPPARPLRTSPPPPSISPECTSAPTQTRTGKAKAIAAPSTSYMIALLTMRYRYAAAARRQRVPSDGRLKTIGMGAAGAGTGVGSAGGRRSRLRLCAWAADNDGLVLTDDESEDEFDCDSVVDWYI